MGLLKLKKDIPFGLLKTLRFILWPRTICKVQKLESDSLLAINSLCKELNSFSPLFLLFLDVMHFNNLVGISLFKHVHRTANDLAHRVRAG